MTGDVLVIGGRRGGRQEALRRLVEGGQLVEIRKPTDDNTQPLVNVDGVQILGERTDHPYSKACDCSTCGRVRAKAADIREKALEALSRPMVAEGTRLRTKDNTVYTARHVGPLSLTLQREIPKVRGKAALKALKRQRRAARGAA